MEILAKPWNGLLIALLEAGPQRFGELRERMPAIGDRMLAARLKELQQAGLLVRQVLPGPPVGVQYELTEIGHGFRVVSEAIGRWGAQLDEPSERAQPSEIE